LYYHILGTEQTEDVLVYEDPENPEWSAYIFVTWHGDYMCMGMSKDTAPVNKLWVAKVKDGVLPTDGEPSSHVFLMVGKLEWIKIKDDFDSGLDFVANNGSTFYFTSNLNAPKGSFVSYDLDHPVSPSSSSHKLTISGKRVCNSYPRTKDRRPRERSPRQREIPRPRIPSQCPEQVIRPPPRIRTPVSPRQSFK
jgi:Prolyl oligopeptidase, N-terminal beta-propeller domain